MTQRLTIKEKKKIWRKLRKSPSRRIRAFTKSFDLEGKYLFQNLVVQVVDVQITLDMKLVLTVYSEDTTAKAIADLGGCATFIPVAPEELQVIQ